MKSNVCSFLQMVIVRHKPGLLSDNKKEKFSCSNSNRVYYLSQKFCTCFLLISSCKSVYENFFSLLISACKSVYENFFSLFCFVVENKRKTWFFKCIFPLFLRYTNSEKSEKNYTHLKIKRRLIFAIVIRRSRLRL